MSEQLKGPRAADRREYFRVNDSIRVGIRAVPEDQVERLEELLEQAGASGFTVMAAMAGINAELAISMRRIEQSDPDVATYLRALDRKIDILGRALTAQVSELSDEQPHPVNLSAGGLGLRSEERYAPGQTLEIRMLLFPSLTGVVAYAEVVECEPVAADAAQGFNLRLVFTHLREQDRDILIRHALRCQSNALRQRDRKAIDDDEVNI